MRIVATTAPQSCAMTKPGTSAGRMPANVSLAARKLLEPRVVHAVVHPGATLVAVEQSRVVQQLQMMTHRGLRKADGRRDVADARLTVGLGGDEAQQPQATGIRERPEGRRELVGVVSSRGIMKDGRTARRDLRHGGY
jgi:hypothetical protein